MKGTRRKRSDEHSKSIIYEPFPKWFISGHKRIFEHPPRFDKDNISNSFHHRPIQSNLYISISFSHDVEKRRILAIFFFFFFFDPIKWYYTNMIYPIMIKKSNTHTILIFGRFSLAVHPSRIYMYMWYVYTHMPPSVLILITPPPGACA